MESFLNMLNTQMVMLLYMLVGFLCWKKHIIHEESLQSFIDILMSVALPCMVFNSFSANEISKEMITGSIIALGLASFAAALGFVLGRILFSRYPFEIRSVMQYGSVVNACTFSGLPLVNAIYGTQGMFFASIYIIPNRILMWTLGPTIFLNEKISKGVLKKIMLNPSIIAVILGLVRMATAFPVPKILNTVISGIGAVSNPLSLILVGAILAQADFRQLVRPGVIPLCIVRLGVLPLGVLLVSTLGGVSPLIRGVAVILSAMPIGTTTALFSAKYGADARFASSCVFLTTILSLITVPLITLLF